VIIALAKLPIGLDVNISNGILDISILSMIHDDGTFSIPPKTENRFSSKNDGNYFEIYTV
jgi:hypothetical protein